MVPYIDFTGHTGISVKLITWSPDEKERPG